MKFLEKIGDKKLYRVQRPDLPSRTYIIVNPSSRKIHFDPTITDFNLYKLATECNETFLRFADKIGLFRGAKAKNVCELILVSGGFYYHLNQAFYNVFGYSLPAGFLGARRVLRPKPHAVISYDNLEAISENNITIIGDTIATGATLVDSLYYYLDRAPKVKKILIFTIAGGLPGARVLAEIEGDIKKRYGTELYVFFSDGIFGLADNHTDMHYFHPDSILPAESLRAAERGLGRFLGERLCIIWDWGQRNKNPIGHLEGVVRICRDLGKPARRILAKARQRLREREKSL
ncbi:MAG: hypothetical protein Q8P76_02800 [bacterium]|nr:hypothetical protein [bacterium]